LWGSEAEKPDHSRTRAVAWYSEKKSGQPPLNLGGNLYLCTRFLVENGCFFSVTRWFIEKKQ
jgi:hypothetical protein